MRPRLTRIVATIGPASRDPRVLRRLLEAGMDVARLNASHGDPAFFEQVVADLRRLGEETGRNLAILLDLQGPKIRVGRLEGGGPVELVAGESLEITTREIEGTARRISSTYPQLVEDVEPGDRLLLDDGLLELQVDGKVDPQTLRCTVRVGGPLLPGKGINIPGRALSTPALSEKDRKDLRLAVQLGVDLIALSFVRRADDVRELRRELHALGALLPIIAKIEKPQALDELEAILRESDGLMVARGDLGVEVAPEKVPHLQKMLIQRANLQGLPVITATQMLESMVEHARPTRAEASDVANAIFDGTDAVMLSGETAAGRYPVQSVAMMDRIAREAEASRFYRTGGEEHALAGSDLPVLAMAHAAQRMAAEIDASLIVVYTLSGLTARLMSKLKPGRPILAITPDPVVCRRLALLHGVIPLRGRFYGSSDEMLEAGDALVRATGLLQGDGRVVVLGGTRQFAGATNLLQLRTPGTGDA